MIQRHSLATYNLVSEPFVTDDNLSSKWIVYKVLWELQGELECFQQ